MQLQQINLAFDPEQDRLLLRISTAAGLECRLWLTRRLVKGVWQGLLQLMQATPLARRQAAPEARQAVVDFQREQALRESRFDLPYDAAQLQPVQDAPVLVARIHMTAGSGGGHCIRFAPRSGPAYKLQLDDRLLHAFAQLLQDALKTTDWDLPLQAPQAPAHEAAARKLN